VEVDMFKRLCLIVLAVLLTGCNGDRSKQLEDLAKRVEANEASLETKQARIDQLEEDMEEAREEIDSLLVSNGVLRRLVSLEKEVDQLTQDLSIMAMAEDQEVYDDSLIKAILFGKDDYTLLNGPLKDFSWDDQVLTVDVLEYVAYYDEERIKELGIDTEASDIISGVYIYNAPDDDRTFPLSDKLMIYVSPDKEPGQRLEIGVNDFMDYMKDHPNLSFRVYIVNGQVVFISEIVYT